MIGRAPDYRSAEVESLGDGELLRRYAEEGSQAAFGELVARHVNLVYAVALRQCGGDAHLAEDVSQRVFTDVARKARHLSGYTVLGGWLYRSTQFAASDVVRAERRRRTREQEAQAMLDVSRPTTDEHEWQKLAPVLDQAISDLSPRDRDAVVLRFFAAKPFAEVGATLRLSEDAARMRVDRALEKLRTLLTRRGITSTTAALGAVLTHQAVASAPAGVAASVTAAAIASGGGASMAAAIFMSLTKVQVGLIGGLVVAGVAGFLSQRDINSQLEYESHALQAGSRSVAAVVAENQDLARNAAEVADLRRSSAELEELRIMAENMLVSLQEFDVADDRRQRVAKALAPVSQDPPNGPIFDEKDVDVVPKAIRTIQPIPPRSIWRPELVGEVVVELTVDHEGQVRSAAVQRSTVHEYDAVTVQALKRWEFAPAMKAGQAVNCRVSVPILFKQPKQDAVAPAPSSRRLEKANWF